MSGILHVCFPFLVLVDWLIVGDRRLLPWGQLWLVLLYPLAWLTVVLMRGATDGWVPYGFLLPERGALSLAGHSIGLVIALLAAGVVVWAGSRAPGFVLRGAPMSSSLV
ncbi:MULTISPECIES: Pr6Pr family membrane protein [Microbacterium]|uniref:Pr6Pr family membrane protein n=1 Tax=Microbacterium TaxID=33882 RepID=UPI001D17C877|nr:Pr6Pr family membrane protein [Microbacterium testaceum]MCC4250171.1 Pr6Pr family membrane protein [Microbacterium testaceum]